MSARHRKERSVERKPERVAEHRRHRHKVNQTLHQVLMEGDPEDLALERPVHTTAEREKAPEPTGDEPAPKRVRHWKQPFWKRRTKMRRLRAQMSLPEE